LPPCWRGSTAQLCDGLEQKGLGASRLDVTCQRGDNRAQAVRVGSGLPLRDVRLLWDKIETTIQASTSRS
jgi:protein ImuB